MNNYIGVPVLGQDLARHTTDITTQHMTVIFLGKKLPPITVMTVLSKYSNYKSRFARKRVEQFNDKHIVATIDLDESNWISSLRSEIIDLGVRDVSQWDWNPHVTIPQFKNDNPLDGALDMVIPTFFTFGNPYVSINGKRIYARPDETEYF